MNIKTKTKFIILIILIIISSCSVVFGRYVVESEKTEFTTINIKTCDFIINNFNRYGTLDLYLDGKKVSASISSFNRKMTIGTTYEIKNIKPNEGYILETDINSLKGTINNSTTISLSFKTTSYSISYTLNGGNLTGQNKNYTVESNNFTLPTPTKAGYDFVGWTGTGLSGATKTVTVSKGSTGNRSYTANWVDDIRPTIHGAWITSGPTYEVRSSGYGYRVNIQVSCSDSGSGINRVLTYYDLNGGWTGETNITGSMTDSFWFKPGYRKIRIVVFDNAGNSSETVISVQCG